MFMRLIKLVSVIDAKEGSPLGITVEGFPPLAVYRVGDRYFVTDNLCTHGQALLNEGIQDGLVIECPFHGGRFNIETGEPILFPCQIPLKTYEITLKDDFIYVAAPTPE
jgi:ethylbenzene dioxygenase ferredoxin subunit